MINQSCLRKKGPEGKGILYISDYDNLIESKVLERKVKAKVTVKKAVENIGNVSENLPEKVYEDIRTTTPECVAIHVGSSILSKIRKNHQQIEHARQETIIAATNIFSSAVRPFKSKTAAKKIIIVKQPVSDRPSLKSSLALLFNETLTNLWLQSPHKADILLCCDSYDRKQMTENLVSAVSKTLNLNINHFRQNTSSLRNHTNYAWKPVRGTRRTVQNFHHRSFAVSTYNRFQTLGN